MTPLSIQKHLPTSTTLADDVLATSPEARSVVSAIQVRIAYDSAALNMVAGIAGAVIMMLAMAYGGGGALEFPPGNVLWGAVTFFAVSMGLVLVYWFKSRARLNAETPRAARLYTVNALWSGACYGSSSWLMLPARTPGQEDFLMIAIAMIVMGAVGAQAVLRSVAVAFGSAVGIVYATGLIRFGDRVHVLLGCGYVVFCAAILMYARTQERAITTAITLSLKNQELLALRTEQQQVAIHAQAEAERAREQAERADRAKTTFIAAASHDLRQPMHALVQYVGHLRGTQDQASAGSIIAKIEDSVSAMAGLLNAVLDFTKISTGAIVPRIDVVDLQALLLRTEMQIRPVAESKRLALRFECVACRVSSDEMLLERIVMNVVHNAVRYTANGSVTVRAALRGKVVRLLIADTDIGIPASEKSKIFDEYYQINNQARDRSKGLGLGLAIVRDLCELLGVKIRLKSINGQGSTFAFDLIATQLPIRQTVFIDNDDNVDFLRGAFVVLIDDDALARDAVAGSLLSFGCRVSAAASCEEALAELARIDFPPQLVVADYRLSGGLTGLDAISTIVAHQSSLYGDSTPPSAILISGDTSPRELKNVADAGYRMLHKPVSIECLYRELNAMLGARSVSLELDARQEETSAGAGRFQP